MPQKEHLPTVSAKEQRMYEHIKESELKARPFDEDAQKRSPLRPL